MTTRRELFRISDKALDLIVNTGVDTVNETLRLMSKMGVSRLPFDKVDIECNIELLQSIYEKRRVTNINFYKGLRVRYNGVRIEDMDNGLRKVLADNYEASMPNCGWKTADLKNMDNTKLEAIAEGCRVLCGCLIFLLATTNAEKTREAVKAPPARHKPHSFQARYSGVTTITGRATSYVSDDEHQGSAPRVTHVRRGHIRNQRHGAGRTQQKQVWIAPVIVNATLGDLAPRHSYKV